MTIFKDNIYIYLYEDGHFVKRYFVKPTFFEKFKKKHDLKETDNPLKFTFYEDGKEQYLYVIKRQYHVWANEFLDLVEGRYLNLDKLQLKSYVEDQDPEAAKDYKTIYKVVEYYEERRNFRN